MSLENSFRFRLPGHCRLLRPIHPCHYPPMNYSRWIHSPMDSLNCFRFSFSFHGDRDHPRYPVHDDDPVRWALHRDVSCALCLDSPPSTWLCRSRYCLYPSRARRKMRRNNCWPSWATSCDFAVRLPVRDYCCRCLASIDFARSVPLYVSWCEHDPPLLHHQDFGRGETCTAALCEPHPRCPAVVVVFLTRAIRRIS